MWPVPYAADRTTGPWLKAPLIDSFPPLKTKNLKLKKGLKLQLKVTSREAASQIL